MKPRRPDVPAAPIRTDRYARKCKRFGCGKVIAALGPKAVNTVGANMRAHVKAQHAKELEAEAKL